MVMVLLEMGEKKYTWRLNVSKVFHSKQISLQRRAHWDSGGQRCFSSKTTAEQSRRRWRRRRRSRGETGDCQGDLIIIWGVFDLQKYHLRCRCHDHIKRFIWLHWITTDGWDGMDEIEYYPESYARASVVLIIRKKTNNWCSDEFWRNRLLPLVCGEECWGVYSHQVQKEINSHQVKKEITSHQV